MISFRSHALTLIAVFLALAVGVVLGAGPLAGQQRADDGDGAISATSETDSAELTAAEAAADRGDQVALQLAPYVYADALAGQSVAVVLLPGADLGDVIPEQIEAAGGELAAVVQVHPSLVDPAEKNLVDGIGRQLKAQVADDAVTSGASTYDRLGQLLATAVATTDSPVAATDSDSDADSDDKASDKASDDSDARAATTGRSDKDGKTDERGQRSDAGEKTDQTDADQNAEQDGETPGEPPELSKDSATILETTDTAKLTSVVEQPQAPAQTILVVGGEPLEADTDPIVGDLMAGLSTGSQGAVLALPADGDDLDARLPDVTVVPGVDRPAGAVAAVLALTGLDVPN